MVGKTDTKEGDFPISESVVFFKRLKGWVHLSEYLIDIGTYF